MADDTENKPKHPGSANLKPFPPGVSGNPAGRPKGALNRSTIFTNILESAISKAHTPEQKKVFGEDFEPENVAEQIAAKLVIMALDGDKEAADKVLDNAFGKLADKSESKINGAVTFLGICQQIAEKEAPRLNLPRRAEDIYAPKTIEHQPEGECKPLSPPTK